MQPGQTITPGSSTDQAPDNNAPASPPPAPPTPPTPEPQQPSTPPPPAPEPQVTPPIPAPEANQFEAPTSKIDAPPQVTWTASEYIAHAKGMSWFVLLGLGLFVLIGLVYLITKDVIASVLVGMAGITFGVFAARPPRVLNYAIDSHGITIGQRNYHFAEFKSFALTESGPFPSVLLMPLKRFLPPITVFYDPKEEDAIVNALAAYLPHEDKEPDMVDRLMSRIRF